MLYGLQSPINIGMILRVAESFGADVVVADVHQVLRDSAKLQTISDFACGALQRRPPLIIHDMAQFDRPGRLISTTIDKDSLSLPDLVWQTGDTVILGNEYDGVPEDIHRASDLQLRIPMPAGHFPKPRSVSPIDPTRTTPVSRPGEPSLNVALAAGIIAYSAYLSRAQRSGAG